MTAGSQSKTATSPLHVAAIAAGILLVTMVLAILLRDSGSYSTDALMVLGGLGVTLIGLLVMAIDRSM